MLRYRVRNLAKLKVLYDLPDDKSEEIEERFEDGERIYVKQDGSVVAM